MSADNWVECPRCVANNDVGYRANEFREDYGIYGAETGTVTVEYRGVCQRCHLRLEFTEVHPIPGYAPPVRQYALTWGTTPAGFEVLAPGGQWYRIDGTRYSKHTGMQMVTMLGKEWSRLPGDPVTARGWDPAIEALGFPEVLEDEA